MTQGDVIRMGALLVAMFLAAAILVPAFSAYGSPGMRLLLDAVAYCF